MVSPATTGPTPWGVPVGIRSPGSKRHDLGDIADDGVEREDEIPRVALLPDRAVDSGLYRKPRPGIDFVRDQRADRAKSVETLGAGELAVFLLQVARSHVVHAGIAKNVGTNIFVRRQLVARSGDHHSEFAFVVDALGDLRPANRSARGQQ